MRELVLTVANFIRFLKTTPKSVVVTSSEKDVSWILARGFNVRILDTKCRNGFARLTGLCPSVRPLLCRFRILYGLLPGVSGPVDFFPKNWERDGVQEATADVDMSEVLKATGRAELLEDGE